MRHFPRPVALVTGFARGLGLAVAFKLARAVAVTYASRANARAEMVAEFEPVGG